MIFTLKQSRGDQNLRIRGILTVCLALLVFPGSAQSKDALSQRVIENPAGKASAEVSLNVNNDTLYMSWIESRAPGDGTFFFASFDGVQWSRPYPIFKADDLFINWADFPKLAFNGHFLVAAWLQKLGSGAYAYGIRFRTSADDGKTWSQPEWLHDDRSETEHGFVSLAAQADGVAAVWLDGRAMIGGKPGPMQLRGRLISRNGLGPERLIDESTCECCNTDLVLVGGKLVVAYRDKSSDQTRDIYFASVAGDRWRKGEALFEDGWVIHGCPVNGPALDARDGALAAAWFTGGQPGVRLGVSHDQGESFSFSDQFGIGSQGRVDCAFWGRDRVAVSWLDAKQSTGLITLSLFSFKGKPSLIGPNLVVDQTPSGRVSGFPRMVVFRDELILAYQDPDGERIKIKGIRSIK